MDDNHFYTVRGYQLLEQHKGVLTPSLEDYLEMIYRCIQNDGYIRVNALAKVLNVRPSSVSKMIMKLAQLGFIDYEKYGVIRLTNKGDEIGKYLLWRHEVIYIFLNLISITNSDQIFVKVELAEHIFSKDTVKNIEVLISFFTENKSALSNFKNCLYEEQIHKYRNENL